MVKTFDPCVFDVSQQDAAVAMLKGLRVAFEDVEEFLDDGLVDGVVVPNKDSAILYISADGDAFVFRRRELLFVSHEVGAFHLEGMSPHKDKTSIYERMNSVNYEYHPISPAV